MFLKIKSSTGIKPELDPEFTPAVLWNREYINAVNASGLGGKLVISVERANGAISSLETEIFPHDGTYRKVNLKYVERLIKSLLWIKGGFKIYIAGCPSLAKEIFQIYSPAGRREFDYDIIHNIHINTLWQWHIIS